MEDLSSENMLRNSETGAMAGLCSDSRSLKQPKDPYHRGFDSSHSGWLERGCCITSLLAYQPDFLEFF